MKKGLASILILSPFFRPNIGGVETYLNDLCEYLRRENYTVFVITYQPLTSRARGLKVEKEDGLEIRRILWLGHNWFHKLEPYPVLEFLYLTPCLFVYTFFFLLKNHRKIDVIHAQGLNAAFIARFLARVFKKWSVISTCAVYNLQGRGLFSKIVKWTLHPFDKILPLANFSKRLVLYLRMRASEEFAVSYPDSPHVILLKLDLGELETIPSQRYYGPNMASYTWFNHGFF